MSDRLILESAGIDQNICFKYDDIYFPYIVVWYSTEAHKAYYQVFYDSVSAQTLYNVLGYRNKQVIIFKWDTNFLGYRSI